MRKIKFNLKWFTWRFLPRADELSVKSIVETLLYLFLFLICLYLFVRWNDVPIRTEAFRVECLRHADEECDIAPVANITYCIPMTSTEWKPENNVAYYGLGHANDTLPILGKTAVYYGLNVRFYYWKTYFRQDDGTQLIINNQEKRDFLNNDSIRNAEISKSVFWQLVFSNDKDQRFHRSNDKTNLNEKGVQLEKNQNYLTQQARRDEVKRRNSEIDIEYLKYKRAYEEFLDKLEKLFGQGLSQYVYYASEESSRLQAFYSAKQSFVRFNSDSIDRGFFHVWANRDKMERKIFSSTNDKEGNVNYTIGQKKSRVSDNIHRKPGWFRLDDISQAYYDIKLESITIDSITLKFDFVGATEFSVMQPVPDKITMSSIEFTDPNKILDIRLNGLKFHAKFIELENRQYIRLFFITTMMSGMFMIFIGMLFFIIMRIIRINRSSKRVTY